MSTSNAYQPDEHDDHELPAKILIFTCAELDRDERAAGKAGAVFEGLLHRLHLSLVELEDIELALRQSARTSIRARHAHDQVLRALSNTDDLTAGVANAQDAFTFYWNTTPRLGADGR